jgi:hypothetical protein
MSASPTRYRVSVHQLRDGKSTKVVEIYGSAFITGVATVTPDGAEDIVDVHLNDSGPRYLQCYVAQAIAEQYAPSTRHR